MSCSKTLGEIWPDDLYIVCGAGQLITPGAVSSTFPTMAQSGTSPGWKIRVIRAGAPLWFGNPGNGSPYFDYTAITGEATWSFPAQDGEEFIIQAYKPAA